MIEPEVVPPASRPRRHRRAVLAGVTLVAVVAGGIAVAAGGHRPEPAPLALMAGNGSTAGGQAENMVAPAASADSRSFAPYPYGGWGLTFKVDGELPALPDRAAAWTVSGPALDRAAVARIAGALGVTGDPVQRDGGWSVDDGDWVLAAYPGGDTWSISYYRSGFGAAGDAAAAGAASAGPVLSGAEAERRVRVLLDDMGAPAGSWKVETTETEIGVGWACAAPASANTASASAASASTGIPTAKAGARSTGSSGTATGGGSSGSVGSAPVAPDVIAAPTPADKPAPGGAVAPCPPPPAPVKGFNVALYPLLDGQRADWPVWNVTLRADGRIENLYGSWATFHRGAEYKLRGVDAALKELQSPPQPATGITDDIAPAVDPVAPLPPDAVPPIAAESDSAEPASGSGAGTKGGSAGPAVSTPSRLPLEGGAATGATTGAGVAVPAIAPAPVCPPMDMPMAAEKATSSFAPPCLPPTPQVVTITGVELGLVQAPVFEDGRVRLHLVPSYRFRGHFDNGTPWETSVIALHPDAIAPPPNIPIADDPRKSPETPNIGQAVPPTPPAAESVVPDAVPRPAAKPRS